MRCSCVRKHLSAYIDDELPLRLRARIERHLAGCPECRERREDLVRLIQSVRRLATVEPSEEFLPATMRQIRAAAKVPRLAAPLVRRWVPALAAFCAVVLGVAGWVVFSGNRAERGASERSMLVQVAFLDGMLSDGASSGLTGEALSMYDETVLLPALEDIQYEASSGAMTAALVGQAAGIEEIVETLSNGERTEFRTVLLDMVKEEG